MMPEKALRVREILGSELSSIVESDDGIIQDLYELSYDNQSFISPIDFALILFMTIGSSGPNNPPFYEQTLSSYWEGKTLVFRVQDEHKGKYIGKGGCHIKIAQQILQKFGYYLRLD